MGVGWEMDGKRPPGPRSDEGATSQGPREPKAAGADWTDERGTSEEGRRRLKGAPERVGKQSQPVSFYEAVGGEETFTRLVHRFYQGVATDPVLRPVYPAKDLGPAEEHLRLFLMQYWGGPRTYDELRGHPRLRMRHARFTIGEAERDAWLHHMRVALDELELDQALAAQLWDYLVMAAQSLINVEPAQGRPDLGLKPA